VPSGGGHWAVQGPFAVPAAVKLHASLPATAMGVAIGEQVANMLQPFWVLPVVSIAGIGIQRVLGGNEAVRRPAIPVACRKPVETSALRSLQPAPRIRLD